MSLTAATRAQLQRVNDGDGVLLFLLIDSPSLSAAVRVVRDTRKCDLLEQGADGVWREVTYQPLPIEVTMPQDVPGEQARAQIEMDNIGRDVLSELETLPVGQGLKVTLRVASRATPGITDYRFTALMSKATANYGKVAISIGDDALFRQQAVRLRYDPQTAPGLF